MPIIAPSDDDRSRRRIFGRLKFYYISYIQYDKFLLSAVAYGGIRYFSAFIFFLFEMTMHHFWIKISTVNP